MSFSQKLAAAIGNRVTLRLRESDGQLRDLMGVLQTDTTLITKRNELVKFEIESVVLMRVIPVFNRQNLISDPFSIYDTQSREVRAIVKVGEIKDDKVVNFYCCGPTVYRDAHIGNLRTFLLADFISRAISVSGYEVKLIQNITDVGHMADDFVGMDKMLEQAAKEQKDPFEIARIYEDRFHKDLAALNVIPAHEYPRASEYMPEIIASIEKLIERKSAYVGDDGSVYFDSQSFPTYGAISGNRLEALKPGHRYEFKDGDDKRFHADWALWKIAGTRTQMIWESPWGKGFPGWHIECSAMSINELDATVDIHLGGIDLRFPHHENERAQSNSLTGAETVALWAHGEHLLFEGRKMSKSASNVVLLNDVIARGLDPLSLRFVFLENRYRSQMDLSWASLDAAHATLKRWRKLMASWGDGIEIKFDLEINQALMNDFDAPRAMQRLRSIEKDQTIGTLDKRAIFLYADQVFGLDLDRVDQKLELPVELSQLLKDRESARLAKDWAASDALRDRLAQAGVEVHDSASGQSWSWR